MGKNPELEAYVLASIFNEVKENDISLRLMTSERVGLHLLKSKVLNLVNTEHRIRLQFDNHIGYGFDFEESDKSGKTGKELYDVFVSKINSKEKLVSRGVIDERYGLYITKVNDS
jgi:hypothetical protein